MEFKATLKTEELLKKFKTGTVVYLLIGPNEYQKTQVSKIEAFLIDSEQDGFCHVIPQRVQIQHMVFHYDYFKEYENCFETSCFYRNMLFFTEDEVKTASEFVKVSNISDEDWDKAVGNRETDEDFEECELQSCCSVISDIRDLFLKCRKFSGLIRFDIKRLSILLDHHESEEEHVILKKILDQLGLNW